MHEKLLLVLGLLFAVMLLVMLAQRLRIAYPIFLVVAGLAIGFVPGMPTITMDPDLIFLIFLPPLLYEAAWNTSWKEFKKWRNPIGLLAFGLVFSTSIVVAFVANVVIPGFSVTLGFLLGGIISPPDAIAATTVLKGLKVPRRTITILEGESLVNDASSLIVFRFALAAILTGTFAMHQAAGQFILVAGMGVVTGLAGAHIMYSVHRFLPTNAATDTVLTLITPYILFLSAEHFHFSGVMAVVSGGLFMSFRAHEVFTSGGTRVNMLSVWHTLIFILNALVFILIGLELPEIVKGLGNISVRDAALYGLLISFTVIALRIAWVYLLADVPWFLSRQRLKNVARPGWKNPLIIGWAGMRGVVSLATALSVPLVMMDGTAFPQRSLIIFITFCVIVVTLVFQGLTLPLIIRLIRIKELDPTLLEHEQHTGIRLRLDELALDYLQQRHSSTCEQNSLLRHYAEQLKRDTAAHRLNLDPASHVNHLKEQEEFQQITKAIHDLQRKELFKMKSEHTYTDETIRKAEHLLDISDLKISQSTR